MDALLASDTPIASSSKRVRPGLPHQKVRRGKEKEAIDASLHSILPATRLAPSLHSSHTDVKPSKSLGRIADKKLRSRLAGQQIAAKRAALERQDVQDYLNTGDQGGIEVDLEEGERTWRVGQDEVKDEIAVGSKGKRFDLKLENIGGGGYRVDYTRNGRQVATSQSI
jgi:U3 small nucleolar RNA-associated protein 7